MIYPISLITFITHLLLLDTARHSLSSPIDFEVGNYLHKFFKNILPNNTEFRRKPGHENPLKKYSVETTTAELPKIEGLSFQMAEHKLPTFNSKGNITISFYNPYTTTNGTTPSKEALLKMGNALKEFFSRKSGILKDAYANFRDFINHEKSTIDTNIKDVFDGYDDQLGQAMDNAAKKMFKRVDDMYTKKDQKSTLPVNFVADLKNIYNNQLKNLFTTDRPTTESATYFKTKLSESQEKRDAENMKNLGALEDNFANRSVIEKKLGEVYTAAPNQWQRK
uniref:Uncharacterized protein n=1 Tax=Cacopsylla melanoneura TaxID=428564 RepID=A0A8D8SL48_9HEMI